MDSFEANKIFGAVLATIFVLFGGSLLSEGFFHAEAPETPGYAIVAAVPDAGAAASGAAAVVVPVATLLAAANPEAGAAQFKKCQACHAGEDGGPNKVGPGLWGVVNRPIAAHPGFSYSAAMTAFAQGGSITWDFEHLNGFIANPKGHVPGTAMGFAGIKNDQDRADLLLYLNTLSPTPAPLPAPPATAPAEAAAAPNATAPADGPASGSEGDPAPSAGAAAPAAGSAGAGAPAPQGAAPAAPPAAPAAPAASQPVENTAAPVAVPPAVPAPAAPPAPAPVAPAPAPAAPAAPAAVPAVPG